MCDDYADRDFKILAFPCDQFGKQEPGSHEEILKFVEQYGFPKDNMTFFEKAPVNGSDSREVFSFLKQKLPNEDETSDIRWNFAKFLIDHEGKPYKRYGSKTPPNDMRADIDELLKQKESS